ncbi:MAG: alanine racemase [Deltaproteobacteria bacterium]|nr:alanine racemase [bacterium]MCB9475888.1 alanine racemase [Deltaproteobacteria bacterium]MCB9488550.1 alanine racemase [Deltaproteobacteria bacterium]
MFTQYTARPTFAKVDIDALENNYRAIQRHLGDDIQIMGVVKADAYGHGAVAYASNLERLGASAFGVAFSEEGVRLREGGITRPIVVLGGIYFGEAEKTMAYNLTPVIISRANAEATIRQFRNLGVKNRPVHLKIDTGMNRIGLQPHEAVAVAKMIRDSKVLYIEGLMSHLATVKADVGEYYWHQYKNFTKVVEDLAAEGIEPPIIHFANSAGSIAVPKPPFNMIRAGVILYGSYPSPEFRTFIDLKPVLTLSTKITQVKKVPKGSLISYEGTYQTPRASIIATIPMGYADGLNRLLSNKGHALVHGKRVPIVGNVCMDMTMLDVSEVPDATVGDDVVLIGEQNGQRILANELAEHCGTIPYEIFTNINHRVARIYYKSSDLKV